MRACRCVLPFVIAAGCSGASAPEIPLTPPDPHRGFPFRHSILLPEVGCAEYYGHDPAVTETVSREFYATDDTTVQFSPQRPCDRDQAVAVCEKRFNSGVILNFLYKYPLQRGAASRCRETRGTFEELVPSR